MKTFFHGFDELQDELHSTVEHLDGAVLHGQVLRDARVDVALLGSAHARDVVDADPLSLLRCQGVVKTHEEHCCLEQGNRKVSEPVTLFVKKFLLHCGPGQ